MNPHSDFRDRQANLMRRIIQGSLWLLAGSAILCLFSTFQKMFIGAPLGWKGYLVPFVFGGGAGFAMGMWHVRLRRANERLRQSRNELQTRVSVLSMAFKNTARPTRQHLLPWL